MKEYHFRGDPHRQTTPHLRVIFVPRLTRSGIYRQKDVIGIKRENAQRDNTSNAERCLALEFAFGAGESTSTA